MTDPTASAKRPTGLLLSRDLIFTSKVTSTANGLGYSVMVAGNVALASKMITESRPTAVFVDLASGDLASTNALETLRSLAGQDIAFIAFGSHVDTVALAAAAAAGCDPVLPRSRFTAELPDLIRRFLGEKNRAGSSS